MDYDIGPLADLEFLTLEAGPDEPSPPKKSTQKESENATQQQQADLWKQSLISHFSGPALRHLLKLKALQARAANSNNAESEDAATVALTYETAALKVWTLWKYQTMLETKEPRDFLTKHKIHNVVAEPPINDLMKLCRKILTETASKAPPPTPAETAAFPERTIADKLAITETLIERCKTLPAAWTVLQVTKQLDLNEPIQTMAETLCSSQPLHFTLFAYAFADLNANRPLQITIEPSPVNGGATNIFRRIHDIAARLSAAATGATPGLEADIQSYLTEMRSSLGAWPVALLHGKPASAAACRIDAIISQLVHSELPAACSARQRTLCCLLARVVPLLERAELVEAARHIAGDNVEHLERIVVLLVHRVALQLPAGHRPQPGDYYTTVLVLDEQLDSMAWEMTAPLARITRIGSLALLFRLHDRYASELRGPGGVIELSVASGVVLSNPERNLEASGRRMRLLFDAMRPQYRRFVDGEVPGTAELTALLADTDVYVYAGHGSGLQFMDGRELAQARLHCVVFLYGCESVALKAKGRWCEAFGPHLYLQYSLCPTIIGMLHVITDTWADMTTMALTTMWLNSGHHIDIKTSQKWLTDWNALYQNMRNYEPATNMILAQPRHRELLDVMQVIRSSDCFPLKLRVSLVARGLPVMSRVGT